MENGYLHNHVEAKALGNKHPSSSKTRHSTETTLLSIQNEVILALLKGEATAVVLPNLPAANDTIDHDNLLNRLSSCFGICGSAITWFLLYLTDRFQCTEAYLQCTTGFSSPIHTVFTLYHSPFLYHCQPLQHWFSFLSWCIYVHLTHQCCFSFWITEPLSAWCSPIDGQHQLTNKS